MRGPMTSPEHIHIHRSNRLLAEQIAQQSAEALAPPSTQFSIGRAVRSLLEGRRSLAPVEHEVSAMITRETGQQPTTGNSILIPTHALVRRDLTVASAPGGGYLVATDLGPVAHFLRLRSVVGRFGATILPNLRGNVLLPRVSTGAAVTWQTTESTPATEQTPATGQIALTPKTVTVKVDVSRQLLDQSNVDVVLSRHCSDALAAAADTAAIDGTGAAGQPRGLAGTSGVNAIAGASIDWAKVLDFIVNAGTQHLDVTGYAMPVAIYKLLANRARLTGGSIPILHDGTIDGRPALHSSAIPAASLIAGPWPELWIGEWGAVELAFDPYTSFTSAIVSVNAMFSLDIAVRYPSAFSVASSIT
jgi:HK97 family phage major capsid protein